MQKRLFVYVEDDPVSRKVMELMVEELAFPTDLIIFMDSHDIMARLYGLPKRPDLILLDIHISPYNGFEVLRLIRQDSNLGSSVVAAVTASVMNEEVVHLRSVGFNGGIAKPLDMYIFPALVERLLTGEAIWHIL